jgi:NAD(P) transhydrogenase
MIYAIPEVSHIGATEVERTKDSIAYEVRVSQYRELARGQIAGDSYGKRKLLVSNRRAEAAGRAHRRHAVLQYGHIRPCCHDNL